MVFWQPSPWARQNIGTTQGGETVMVKMYLLYQYNVIAFPDGQFNHVTGCKPLSDTHCT